MAMCKSKLLTARNGYDVLKTQRDSLRARADKLRREILIMCNDVKGQSELASFSYAEAHYDAGNFSLALLDAPHLLSSCQLHSFFENCCGIRLPTFTLYETRTSTPEKYLGLAGGAKQIRICKETYQHYLEFLVEMASERQKIVILLSALRAVSRRVNALEFMFIPRLENDLVFISRELEENEREELNRIKLMLDKKHKAEHVLEMQQLNKAVPLVEQDSKGKRPDTKEHDSQSYDSSTRAGSNDASLSLCDSSDDEGVVFFPCG